MFVFLLRQSIMPGRFYSLPLSVNFIRCSRQYHALRVPFRQPVMLLAAQSSSSRQPTLSCCPASLHFVASPHFIPFSRSAVHRLPIILLACGSLKLVWRSAIRSFLTHCSRQPAVWPQALFPAFPPRLSIL